MAVFSAPSGCFWCGKNVLFEFLVLVLAVFFSNGLNAKRLKRSYRQLPLDGLDELIVEEVSLLAAGLDLLWKLRLVPETKGSVYRHLCANLHS